MRRFLFAIAVLLSSPAGAVDCSLKPGATEEQARSGPCGFSAGARTFHGPAEFQARCLTRQVQKGGRLGRPTVTRFLAQRIGKGLAIAKGRLAAYLAGLGIDPARELGGDPAVPITADYFIIHDTSTPNCSEPGWSVTLCPEMGKLPEARDTAAWATELGFLGHPKPAPDRLAHAWTDRIGRSITEVTFDLPLRSTKFESCLDTSAKAGLFLAVENTQPRIAETGGPPSDGRMNDRIAPVPASRAPSTTGSPCSMSSRAFGADAG
jgi:hypothetical protein